MKTIWKSTLFVQLFGLTKVPMIFFVGPRVLKMDDAECIIKIPLNRRTKNHLNSMYFGVLSTGADIAGGLVAMNEIKNSKQKISLSFKDFHAEFLKRAHGDVHFVCKDIPAIKSFVAKVCSSSERHQMPVNISAYVPSINPNEEVARFTLTLSLKKK